MAGCASLDKREAMKTNSRLFHAFAMMCILTAGSGGALILTLGGTKAATVDTGEPAPQEISASNQSLLRAYIADAQLPGMICPEFQAYQTEVREFYDSYGNNLPWLYRNRVTPQALRIIDLLKNADAEGLYPSDYDGPDWDGRIAIVNRSGGVPEADLIHFDLALTVSVMRYVSDLHRARVNPRLFHFDLDIGNQNVEPRMAGRHVGRKRQFLRPAIALAALGIGALAGRDAR